MLYKIPGSACANRRPIEVSAAETGVLGLLATESDARIGWNVTHEKSGFIVAHWPDKDKALASAKQLGKLPINWSESARSIFEQTAKLNDVDIDKFMVARGVPQIADHEQFRKGLWEKMKDPTFPRMGR